MNQRGLSHTKVEQFYDGHGAKQDGAGYYENATWNDLIAHAKLDEVSSIFEFGGGTGKFAELLLSEHLHQTATYWGCDVSSSMVGLSKKRLEKFGERVHIWKSSGEFTFSLPDESVDVFVSNYVLDILSDDEIKTVIDEAQRILKKGGLLCLTGLTHGKGLLSKLWTAFWHLRFMINPQWVGGCRPVALLNFLSEWDVLYRNVLVARAISSEVVLARKSRLQSVL
jgi:ubiquinone/menaquinone biosynthesis C-methylase UbiE